MKAKTEPQSDWISGLAEGIEQIRERGTADPELLDALLQFIGRCGQLVPAQYRSIDAINMGTFEGDEAAGTAQAILSEFLPAFAMVAACCTSLPGAPSWNKQFNRK